jgi:hypothetical protein
LVVADPDIEWTETGAIRSQISEWTRMRGNSPRLYPAALVWCLKKPGRNLRDRVESLLAWRRVAREVTDGTLGGEFDRNDRAELQSWVKDAEDAAKDEVWGDYRFAIITDSQEADGLKVIDLGIGHSSSAETLCGRVLIALKSQELLNESVSAGYVDRHWPPALRESGAWPLASLRQSFLNGSLTRLLDPDAALKSKVPEFVERGDFGFASGRLLDGSYQRFWFREQLPSDEVAFEDNVFLIRKGTAEALKSAAPAPADGPQLPQPPEESPIAIPPGPVEDGELGTVATVRKLRLVGTIPPEVWNRLGTRVLPKLRSGSELSIGVEFAVIVPEDSVRRLTTELQQALQELGLADAVRIE